MSANTGPGANLQAGAKVDDPSLPAVIGPPDTVDIDIQAFEVVVAFNLDPPWRYAQEFYWLEVLAETPERAVEAATEWVMKAGDNFEATDFVRLASPHELHCGVDHHGDPMEVRWNIPLLDETPAHSMVRDPVSGNRIGFVADEKATAKWVDEAYRSSFAVVMRKPTSTADPVCLVPLVRSTSSA